MSEYPTYLIHYGTPGQKWGVRKYQFEDGTWTEEGKRRRRIGDDESYGSSKETGNSLSNYGSNDKGDFAKSIKADVEAINGGSKGHKYGFNRENNCAFCAMSYELRRRGHNVRAQESAEGVQTFLTDKRSAYGRVIPNFDKVSQTARKFSDSKNSYITGMTRKEYKDMKEQLISDGDGSRGFISVQWKEGYGGHIFNYEVNNGELYFVDTQPGTIKKADNSFHSDILSNAWFVQTLKTNDLKINEEKAKKYYAEDDVSEIRLSKLKMKAETAAVVGSLIGTVGGVAATAAVAMATGYLFPYVALVVGPALAAMIGLPSQIKADKENDKETEKLNEKWKQEKRREQKWYELKEDKESTKKSSDKSSNKISAAEQSRIQALISSGKTQAEVAKILGVSVSTVNKYK